VNVLTWCQSARKVRTVRDITVRENGFSDVIFDTKRMRISNGHRWTGLGELFRIIWVRCRSFLCGCLLPWRASRNYVIKAPNERGGGEGEGQEVRVTRRYVTVYFGGCTEPKCVTQWEGERIGGKKSQLSRYVVSGRSLRNHPEISQLATAERQKLRGPEARHVPRCDRMFRSYQ